MCQLRCRRALRQLWKGFVTEAYPICTANVERAGQLPRAGATAVPGPEGHRENGASVKNLLSLVRPRNKRRPVGAAGRGGQVSEAARARRVIFYLFGFRLK